MLRLLKVFGMMFVRVRAYMDQADVWEIMRVMCQSMTRDELLGEVADIVYAYIAHLFTATIPMPTHVPPDSDAGRAMCRAQVEALVDPEMRRMIRNLFPGASCLRRSTRSRMYICCLTVSRLRWRRNASVSGSCGTARVSKELTARLDMTHSWMVTEAFGMQSLCLHASCVIRTTAR